MEQQWQTGKPPNETEVEVEYKGKIIIVKAFYGRDGYRPHWITKSEMKFDPTAFTRWRKVSKE